MGTTIKNNIKLNVIFGNKKKLIEIEQTAKYKDFIFKIFSEFSFFTPISTPDIKNSICDNFKKNLYITFVSKHIVEKNWEEMKKVLYPEATIFVSNKLKGGGLVPPIVVVLAIIAILSAISGPVKIILNTIIKIGEIIVALAQLLFQMLQIIPLIFDPPKFIDDILFGITWGINNLFSKVIASMNTEKEEDPNSESGTFGVSEENQKLYTCADPTLGMILLLVVCPPLAIFYKLGIEGMVSAIICGVLCVKLYYFPGLLFAILHVLC